jgi:cell wall assembly regulator SMI1
MAVVRQQTQDPTAKGHPMAIEVEDAQRDPHALWRAYLDWLADHAPRAAAVLNPRAADAAIEELERLIGHQLPEAVKAGWRLHDGQDCDTVLGVASGFWWLPVADVVAQWTNWRELRQEEDEEFFEAVDLPQRSYPRKAIQRKYTSPGWIPLLGWPFNSDYIGLDFDPGPAGTPGQVINFGRDQEQKFVIADDYAMLLAWLVQEARAGRITCNVNDDEIFEHVDGILLIALYRASGADFGP